ncbi:MAG: SDR family NAD(P)-dependent oxidoreductase [Actinomycetota bacterium]|nr:SDR family NAD(P)-dependent oxidoreductase [Actinomycetota bacterium]
MPRPLELARTVAVITGAGSGIGRATAHSLARRGSRVVVTDIDRARAASVAGEIGDRAVALGCDVTRATDLEQARDAALEHFGQVDLVMNNVGVLAVGPLEAIPLDAWQRVVDINLMSVVRSNLVFVPHLVAQGSGHIVNTASTAGLLPYGFDRLPYTTTKHAIVGLSQALALYLAPRGVGVSCLCPAGVMTNIVEQITFFGEPAPPAGPSFPIEAAETLGELVADGVSTGRFLITTAPEVQAELQALGADMDAYLHHLMGEGSP